MVRLENVMDTRTGQFHSVVVCKKRNARFYVPVSEVEEHE